MQWKEIQRITIKVKALGYDVDNMTITEILNKYFNKYKEIIK